MKARTLTHASVRSTRECQASANIVSREGKRGWHLIARVKKPLLKIVITSKHPRNTRFTIIILLVQGTIGKAYHWSLT